MRASIDGTIGKGWGRAKMQIERHFYCKNLKRPLCHIFYDKMTQARGRIKNEISAATS